MENDKHYFLVGLFVLATIIGALGFTIWLTSAGEGNFVHYRIRFAESVSGLSVGGAVKFRGVNVGSVDSIAIDPDDTRLIRVDIKVAETTPVKTDTVASLKLQGITGVVFVELTGGSKNMPSPINFVAKDEVPEIKAAPSQLNAIIDRLPELLDRISRGVEQINKLVSDQNVAAFSDILAQWQNISRNGNQMTQNLNNSSRQFDSVISNLKQASVHVNNITEKVDDNPSSLIFPGTEKGIPAP